MNSPTTSGVTKFEEESHDINDDSALLDLSIKQVWMIVYFEDSDPGNEFEIISERQLVQDSWNTLKKGSTVAMAFGSAKVLGVVVSLSEDMQYLTKNFNFITQEFLKGRTQRRLKQPHRLRMKREVIKIMDSSTQTDTVETDAKLPHPEFLELQEKYEVVKHELKKMKLVLKNVKSGVLSVVSAIDDEDVDSESLPAARQPLTAFKQENDSRLNMNGENEADTICIGPGKSRIPLSAYESINWASYSAATRKLLIQLFPRNVLASHSLTGKPSPAFGDKEAKMRLNPSIVADIVDVVSKKCKVSPSLVRSAITTKCADENKMYKRRNEKKKSAV